VGGSVSPLPIARPARRKSGAPSAAASAGSGGAPAASGGAAPVQGLHLQHSVPCAALHAPGHRPARSRARPRSRRWCRQLR